MLKTSSYIVGEVWKIQSTSSLSRERNERFCPCSSTKGPEEHAEAAHKQVKETLGTGKSGIGATCSVLNRGGSRV